MSAVLFLLLSVAAPRACYRVKMKAHVSSGHGTTGTPPEFGFEYETKWLTCWSVPEEHKAPREVCAYDKGTVHGLLGGASNGVMLTSDVHYFGLKRDDPLSEMELVGMAIPTVGGGRHFCEQLRNMGQLDKILSDILAPGKATGQAESWRVKFSELDDNIAPLMAISMGNQLNPCVERVSSESDTNLIVFSFEEKTEASSIFEDFGEEEETASWTFPKQMTGGAQVTFTVDFERLTAFIHEFHAFETQSTRSVKQRLGSPASANNWKAIVDEIDTRLMRFVTLVGHLQTMGKQLPTFANVSMENIQAKQQALTGFLSIVVYYILRFDTHQQPQAPQYPKGCLAWLFRTNLANVARHVVLRQFFNSLSAFQLFVYNTVKKLKDGKQQDPEVTEEMQSWLDEYIIDERTRDNHWKWCMDDEQCASTETDARTIATTIGAYLDGLWGIDGDEIEYYDLLSSRGLKEFTSVETSLFESMGAFEDFSSVRRSNTHEELLQGITFELRAIERSQMSMAGSSRPGETNFITVKELQGLLHDYYAFLSQFNHGLVENLSELGCDT